MERSGAGPDPLGDVMAAWLMPGWPRQRDPKKEEPFPRTIFRSCAPEIHMAQSPPSFLLTDHPPRKVRKLHQNWDKIWAITFLGSHVLFSNQHGLNLPHLVSVLRLPAARKERQDSQANFTGVRKGYFYRGQGADLSPLGKFKGVLWFCRK